MEGTYTGQTKKVHSSFLHFNKTFAGNINPLMIPVLSECGRTVENSCRERFKLSYKHAYAAVTGFQAQIHYLHPIL
jgi:hypothetical protein